VEAGNVTKNQILKLATQWKYGIHRLKPELNYSEENGQNNAPFMDDGLKIMA